MNQDKSLIYKCIIKDGKPLVEAVEFPKDRETQEVMLGCVLYACISELLINNDITSVAKGCFKAITVAVEKSDPNSARVLRKLEQDMLRNELISEGKPTIITQ
jgi:hypothetical protein